MPGHGTRQLPPMPVGDAEDLDRGGHQEPDLRLLRFHGSHDAGRRPVDRIGRDAPEQDARRAPFGPASVGSGPRRIRRPALPEAVRARRIEGPCLDVTDHPDGTPEGDGATCDEGVGLVREVRGDALKFGDMALDRILASEGRSRKSPTSKESRSPSRSLHSSPRPSTNAIASLPLRSLSEVIQGPRQPPVPARPCGHRRSLRPATTYACTISCAKPKSEVKDWFRIPILGGFD